MASPRRRIWFLIFVLIANFLLMGGPQAGKVYACSCAETRDVEESFEKSAAIFSGRVVKAEGAAPVPPDGDDPFLGPVTFEVEEAWKGASEGSVVVYGQGPEPSCGIDFERGETYLVYAYRSDGYLGTDYCGRTKPLSFAGSDVGELNAARGSLPETGGPRVPSSLQAKIAAGAVVSVLAAAALVSRRPRRD
ncbi:MAG: hypothetical protein H0U91_09680 [Rubrobacter sp.]|jgi:hypothetical protein|nr:hypothetical protein [Rubrobacter sp.]MDQ3360131.1 hypothetical protein [Actinomycetota bacterium]MDQ3377424.1 hypothetical protein [Actinomycetota bacterium]